MLGSLANYWLAFTEVLRIHLYNNFRKIFLGKKLKDIIWEVSKSTYSQSWEGKMREMRDVNEEAFKHMTKTPPRFWSKSQFKTTSKCDSMLNNMYEAFNSVIIEARAKPIVTMLEEIKTYKIERWAKNRMRFANLTWWWHFAQHYEEVLYKLLCFDTL